MTDLSDYLFGALGHEYCTYFYILSILSFITFILTVLSILYIIAKKKSTNYVQLALVAFQPFLAYFINRLFYTMCMNSV